MIEAIRKSIVLDQFPKNLETDLYLYVMDQLHQLRKRYCRAGEQRERVVRYFALSKKRRKGKIKPAP